METNHQTSKEYFKSTSIIHLYLVLGIVLFGLVDYFFIIDFHQVDTQSGLAKLLVYLVPGLVVVGIVASNVIFVIRMNVLKESTDLKLKMMGYRLSLIVRYMLLEGSALFALAAVFMTNNINYIVYAVLLVIMLVLKRPTRKSAITDMQLNQQEIAMLEDPESIIM
jgi:hypothetical protein